MFTQHIPEKTGERKEYSNSYQTLEAVWLVLRDHAGPDRPLSVSEICGHLERQYQDPLLRPSCSTVSKLLRNGSLRELRSFTFRLRCVAWVEGRLIPYDQWEDWLDRRETPARNNRPRLYYLESPLSDGEWRMLSDLVRLCPFLTRYQTERFLGVLKRFHPRQQVLPLRYVCKWGREDHFALMDQLDRAVREHLLVEVRSGRWELLQRPEGWRPVLQPEPGPGRVLAPYALIWAQGGYYLAAWDGFAMRNLRTDRICSLQVLERHFVLPACFDPAEYRDSCPAMVPGGRRLVRLRCRTSLLGEVLDFFGAMPVYTALRNGMMELSMNVVPAGVKLFALQHCDSVEVLHPPELRCSVAASMQEALLKYQQPPAEYGV